MKRRLSLLGCALGAHLTAATCLAAPDLVISQYYEGANSDRWVELTNVSPAKIDMAAYRLGLWSDANAEGYKTGVAPTNSVALTGLLAPGASYLYKHSSAALPAGITANLAGGAGTPADFTGNDSLALYTGSTFSTANLVDAIGFTNVGNEGVDRAYVRSVNQPGWSTAAGSKVTDFASIWKSLPITKVNAAEAGTQAYLGYAAVAAPPTSAGTWQLAFHDEFDGTLLDGAKWRFEGTQGQGGSSPANVILSNGTLKLRAQNQPVMMNGKHYNYGAAQISTFYKYRQQYGYFEARTRYNAVNGLWPAFWTMPDRGIYGNIHATNETYLKFDLTAAGIGAVNTAVLKLNVESADALATDKANNFAFYKLRDDSWSEMTVKWPTKPVFDPLWITQKYNVALTPGQEISVDVKDWVTDELAGDKKVGFAIADTFSKQMLVRFHSREATTAAYRPRLVINGVTYTATEDTYVQWGNGTNVNFGGQPTLMVREAYGMTTINGVNHHNDSTAQGGMELDIEETLGIWGENVNANALHWDGYTEPAHQATGSGEYEYPASADDYHVFGMNWQPGKLEFFVDGVKTWEWVNSRVGEAASRIILSMQLGGWDGNTPGAQIHNQHYEVDWVRSWTGTAATPGTPTEVIVDNLNSAAVRKLGAWSDSTTIPGYYGANYTSDGNSLKGNKNFRFRPTLTANGDYSVYMRWVAASNRATNVPVDIVTGSGSITTVTVNQTLNNNQWVLLGTFPMAASNAEVIIRTDGTTAHVIADAVRFTPVP